MSADNYLTALKAVGITEVTGIDAGYYQGDYFAAVIDNHYGWETTYDSADSIGLLVLGYGSCSGCDEWEGADCAKAKLDILANRVESIKWFDSLDAFKQYLASPAPELEWWAHNEEWPAFVAKVNALGDYNVLEEVK